MPYRFLVFAALGLLLSGCVTASNTLSPEQISSFRLQSIDVTVAPNAWIASGDLGQGAATPHVQFASQAEPKDSQIGVRQVIASKLRTAMLQEVGSHLTGARPVKINVRVHEFAITPGVVRVLIGGNHRMKADADIVDAKTGALLLAFPAHEAFIGAGGGLLGVTLDNLLLDEPADRVIRHYVLQYRNWLLRK